MLNIDNYSKEIRLICLEYQVKRLVLFGSTLSDEFNESSDIDFLLELSGIENGLKRYMGIKNSLEKLFNRPVDLVMPKALRNERLKKRIYSNTKEIYAA